MSVATETELVNLALGHIGAEFIADYATTQSKSAAAARRIYPSLRDSVLSEFQWPWLYDRKALALSATAAPVNWTYRYVYPSNCYRVWAVVHPEYPRKVVNYETGEWTHISFERSYNPAVPEHNILTHLGSAWVDYSYRLTDVSKWPDHFADAFAWALASSLVMDLAKDRKTRSETMTIADRAMRAAKANAVNEGFVRNKVFDAPTAVSARRAVARW